jgi:hypothetical protein
MKIEQFVVRSLVFVCASILFGCGGGQLGEIYKRAEAIPSDKTVIYIYRVLDIMGIYPVDIYVNGKEVTSLSEGAYYPYLSDPGEVEVSTKMAVTRSESVTVDGKGGQAYYLEVQARQGGFFMGQAAITKVSKERGEEKLLETRRAIDKKP